MTETIDCGGTAQLKIKSLAGFALISQENNASLEELVCVPVTSIPSLIAALQRVAGEGEKPAPAPADDGWVECGPGECPMDLKVGDWVRSARRGDGQIRMVDTLYGDAFPYLVDWPDAECARWPLSTFITAYRRTAP